MDPNIFRSKLSDVVIPEGISLTEYLLKQSIKYGDKTALVDAESGRRVTYKQFVQTVNNVSNNLWKHGLRKGDVAFVLLPNCIEYAIIVHSVMVQGGIVSTCNPEYTLGEVSKQLEDCGAKFVFTLEESLPLIKRASQEKRLSLKHIFSLDGNSSTQSSTISLYSDLSTGDGATRPDVKISPKTDCCLIPYSSGTSGLPKGVRLSHYSVLANLLQFNHPQIEFASYDDIYLAFLPYYHLYAIAIYLGVVFMTGSTVVIMKKFDPLEYLKYCEKYKASVLHIVPPVALFLANHPAIDKFDLSSIRQLFVAAAPLKKDLSIELQKRLGIKHVRQGYGMTELSPVATMAHLKNAKHGSSGLVVPNTEMKIMDISTNKSLGINTRGEVWIRGPQVMMGYLNNDKATSETIDKDGWLHTGDIGYFDEDHHLFVVDRIKELIKYKGFQVAPAELEALLITHPSIDDAAVIGIPDAAAGELPRAYVVLKANVVCSEQDIHDFIKKNAIYYKYLRGGIEFRDAIPKTPSGKILRKTLREEYRQKRSSKL